MKPQARTLLAVVVAIHNVLVSSVEGNQNFDPQSFEIHTDSVNLNGDCGRRITITGNGVEDTFQTSCVNHVVDIKQENGALVYGRPPADHFFLYSNAPSELVVIDNGICTKKTYTAGSDPTSLVLSDTECAEVQRTISDIHDRPDRGSSITDDKSSGKKEDQDKDSTGNSGDKKREVGNFDISTKTAVKNGKCIRTINIDGNGVKDQFENQCSTSGVNTHKQDGDKMAYGNWPKDTFYLYSETPGTLVVVNDGKCTKKTYSTTDSTSTSAVLSNTECKKIQEQIKELISGTGRGLFSWIGNLFKGFGSAIRDFYKFLGLY